MLKSVQAYDCCNRCDKNEIDKRPPHSRMTIADSEWTNPGAGTGRPGVGARGGGTEVSELQPVPWTTGHITQGMLPNMDFSSSHGTTNTPLAAWHASDDSDSFAAAGAAALPRHPIAGWIARSPAICCTGSLAGASACQSRCQPECLGA
jgi:hypothetical protein